MKALNKTELEPGTVADPASVRVLLVDDQMIIAEAVRRLLQGQADIGFHWIAKGGDAVRTALEWKPTVILQDLVMPDIDGFEVVRELRRHEDLQHIPVLVLTTTEDPRAKAEGFAAGANDYLVKLPDRLELLARLRYHSAAYVRLLERNAAFWALRESERKLAEANVRLQHLAEIDGLTGLANRRCFDEVLTTEWRRAQRTGHPVSLMMCDIDFFKLYNDGYGHMAGDECLKKVAAEIGIGARRPGDLAARFGGEEFVLVLPNTEAEGALAIAEACRRRVEALAMPNGDERDVTLSIGVASVVPAASMTPAELIESADRALYEAKKGGRNRAVLGTP